MALVDYSDSEHDERSSPPLATGSETGSGRKRKWGSLSPESGEAGRKEGPKGAGLPPLPSSFHDLYPSSSRTSTCDDPSLHGGRMRAVPHVEGNWATHVYLEWHPTSTELTTLSSILTAIEHDNVSQSQKIQSLLDNQLGAQLPLHISLSRPIVLVTAQRQSFSDLLEKSIEGSGVRPFEVQFAGIDWVANYERTRWFLVLRLATLANNALNRLLHLSNGAARAFGQPLLYSASAEVSQQPTSNNAGVHGARRRNRGRESLIASGKPPLAAEQPTDFSKHFHISIGWTLEMPSSEVLRQTRSVNEGTPIATALGGMRVKFASVKLKVGNSVKDMPLPTKVREGKGLIGS